MHTCSGPPTRLHRLQALDLPDSALVLAEQALCADRRKIRQDDLGAMR
jgi:hypothetical protein